MLGDTFSNGPPSPSWVPSIDARVGEATVCAPLASVGGGDLGVVGSVALPSFSLSRLVLERALRTLRKTEDMAMWRKGVVVEGSGQLRPDWNEIAILRH